MRVCVSVYKYTVRTHTSVVAAAAVVFGVGPAVASRGDQGTFYVPILFYDIQCIQYINANRLTI